MKRKSQVSHLLLAIYFKTRSTLRKLALGGELKLVRKPPKVSRGYGGVARAAMAPVFAGGPGGFKNITNHGKSRVAQLSPRSRGRLGSRLGSRVPPGLVPGAWGAHFGGKLKRTSSQFEGFRSTGVPAPATLRNGIHAAAPHHHGCASERRGAVTSSH